MKNLSEYLLEVKKPVDPTLVTLKQDADDWIKKYVKKSQGRLATKIEDDNVVLYFSSPGNLSLKIDWTDCPEGLRFNIDYGDMGVIYMYHTPNEFMSRFDALACRRLDITDASNKMQLKSISKFDGKLLYLEELEIAAPVENINAFAANENSDWNCEMKSDSITSFDMSKLSLHRVKLSIPKAKKIKYPKKLAEMYAYDVDNLVSAPANMDRLYIPAPDEYHYGLKTFNGCTIKHVVDLLIGRSEDNDNFLDEIKFVPDSDNFTVCNVNYSKEPGWKNSDEDKYNALNQVWTARKTVWTRSEVNTAY